MGLPGHGLGAEVCNCKSGIANPLWSYPRYDEIYQPAEGYAWVVLAKGRALVPKEGWGSRWLDGFDSVLRGVGVELAAQAESRVLFGVGLTDNQLVDKQSVERRASVVIASGLPATKERLVTRHPGIEHERPGFVN